jgi:class 3 adenylate cyclase
MMKRRIAAIFAADVVGYSTLVADDEEEALRRLASYRGVIDDFISQFHGRIFNTAGDSVMAAFPSAVDAVRCAIDIQESLRTRNRAYPESRQMLFRIGINVGDVVERDDDLLGDGVNLAARLQAIAEPGGICISRSVHEQVVGKLSVAFDDLGDVAVKNIPTPIHTFSVLMHEATQRRSRVTPSRRSLMLAGALSAVLIAAAGTTLYILQLKRQVVAGVPLPTAKPAIGTPGTTDAKPSDATPVSGTAKQTHTSAAARQLDIEAMPFVTGTARRLLVDKYVPGRDFKAVALGNLRPYTAIGMVSEEAAREAAMSKCAAAQVDRNVLACQMYAVGMSVVWPHLPPPMPPEPWLRRDAQIETPVTVDVLGRVSPTLSASNKSYFATTYSMNKGRRAIAVSQRRTLHFVVGRDDDADATKAALEMCGFTTQAPCRLLVINTTVVLPVPQTMRATAMFNPATHASIERGLRDGLVRRLAQAPDGWNAVAVGTSGHPGLAVQKPTEAEAIDAALVECRRSDAGCAVIAIGQFVVKPEAPATDTSANDPKTTIGPGPTHGPATQNP